MALLPQQAGLGLTSSYRQESLLDFLLAVFPFPPKVLGIWNALLFQKVFDGNAPLATLLLNLFNLFSCKHIVSLC